MIEIIDKKLIPIILECLKDNLKDVEQAKKDLEGIDTLNFTIEEIYSAISESDEGMNLFNILIKPEHWGAILNDEVVRLIADLQYAIATNNNVKIIEVAKELAEGSLLNDSWGV